MVVNGSDPKSDPSSDPKAATHTKNGNLAQKLLIMWFVPKIIPVVILKINPSITANVIGVQDVLIQYQTVLLKASVMNAGRSCASIFQRNSGKVIRTNKDDATPQDISRN